MVAGNRPSCPVSGQRFSGVFVMARFPLWRSVLALVALLVIQSDSVSFAQITAYQIAGTPFGGNQNFGGEFGMDFAVNAPITLRSLGAYDANQNGLSSTITVRLWQKTGPSSGTQIASQVFTPGSPGTLNGGYRFIDLPSALTLAAGDYTISTSGYTTEQLGNENNGSIAAAMRVLNNGGGLLSFGLSRFGNTAGAFPNAGVAPFGAGQLNEFVFLGPSFQFTAVPEPSGMFAWILAAATVAVGWCYRRKLQPRRIL
jgi:hypothetical protein